MSEPLMGRPYTAEELVKVRTNAVTFAHMPDCSTSDPTDPDRDDDCTCVMPGVRRLLATLDEARATAGDERTRAEAAEVKLATLRRAATRVRDSISGTYEGDALAFVLALALLELRDVLTEIADQRKES